MVGVLGMTQRCREMGGDPEGVSAGRPRSAVWELDFAMTAASFHLRPGGGEGTQGSSLTKHRGPGLQPDPFAGLVTAVMPTPVTNVFLEILELGVVQLPL